MHDPDSEYAMGSTAFVENQGLLHAIQPRIIGPQVPGHDVAILTGIFPVAIFSGPTRVSTNLELAEEEPLLIVQLYCRQF